MGIGLAVSEGLCRKFCSLCQPTKEVHGLRSLKTNLYRNILVITFKYLGTLSSSFNFKCAFMG